MVQAQLFADLVVRAAVQVGDAGCTSSTVVRWKYSRGCVRSPMFAVFGVRAASS